MLKTKLYFLVFQRIFFSSKIAYSLQTNVISASSTISYLILLVEGKKF